MATVEFSPGNKVCEPQFQSLNWSKNNFGEIHISQGATVRFVSLSNYSLLMRRNPLRQGSPLMYIFHGLRVWVGMAPRLRPIILFVPIPILCHASAP